jgi:hypothetical protein
MSTTNAPTGAQRYKRDWVIGKLFWDDLAWTGVHKDYDGAPIHSFDTHSPDPRSFVGRTVEDVQRQIDEYEENEGIERCPDCLSVRDDPKEPCRVSGCDNWARGRED